MARVQPPVIPIIHQLIAANPGTISLGQGVVHYGPPPGALRAAAAFSNAPRGESLANHRYGNVAGTAELRGLLQTKLAVENRIALQDERELLVSAGANMAFVNAVLAIADPGDEIILLAPYFFNHEMAVELAGCRPVIVSTDADCQLDLAAIESAITPRTRAVVTVSPSNPTGAVYSRESLAAVNTLCKTRGVYHISDEAYEYFVYGGQQHFSAASLPNIDEHTISLFTLSKAYGMAGWRCGYMVIPEHLEVAVTKIQDTNLVCPPIINQIAATVAMKAGAAWCSERIAGFEQVRDMVLSELLPLGNRCRVPKPDGAFYALMHLDTDKSDLEIVEALIRQFGIAVMPGVTFGVEKGCSLRIAYGALDAETVAEGMGRLTRGLDALL